VSRVVRIVSTVLMPSPFTCVAGLGASMTSLRQLTNFGVSLLAVIVVFIATCAMLKLGAILLVPSFHRDSVLTSGNFISLKDTETLGCASTSTSPDPQ